MGNEKVVITMIYSFKKLVTEAKGAWGPKVGRLPMFEKVIFL